MTDLTGAELALAVARVMGLRDVYEEDETVWRGDGSVYRTEEFRPDTGGAAAWEVWVWLVAQCLGDAEIAGAKVAQQQHIADDYAPEHVPTYTCRAVVALGETR